MLLAFLSEADFSIKVIFSSIFLYPELTSFNLAEHCLVLQFFSKSTAIVIQQKWLGTTGLHSVPRIFSIVVKASWFAKKSTSFSGLAVLHMSFQSK